MSTVNWSGEARKAFALYVTLNSLFGMWPLLQVDLRLKFRMAIGFFEVIFMMIATLYVMIQNCGDAENSLDNLLLIASGIVILSKLITYHVHREKLRDNIVSAIQDWSSIEAIEYRSVMRSYERIYKRITFLMLTTIIWCGVFYFLKVLIFDPDEMIEIEADDEMGKNLTHLVLKKRYLFPSCALNEVSETLRIILIVNQFVQMVTCCLITVGSDAFFLAITIHLYGQFEILKIRFACFDSDANSSITTMSRENMVTLVSRHQHLLRLTELLEGAYNKIILTQLLTSVTLISIAGFSFLIALKAGDFFGSLKSLVVIQYMMLQSFMYTCIGEALQSQGDDITQLIYNGSWYELPRYLRKDLVFVMMRSNVSPHLTAGKLFDVTRVTFVGVVKTSFSYLSVLRIMIQE